MILPNRCISAFAILSVSFLLLTASNIVAAVDATHFDFDGNGHIDPGEEAAAFLRHVNSLMYREIDRNKDGKIQPNESKKYFRDIEMEVKDLLDEYDQNRGTRDAMPIAEANRNFGQPTPTSFGGFLIREKHEDVTVLQDASQFKRAKGAILSFLRHITENENVWTARGAILRPFRKSTGKPPTSKEAVLVSYSVVPSISVDRVNNSKNEQKEVDSLVFRLGSEFEYGGGGLFELQYLRANFGYSSDLNLRSSLPVAEFQWEPVKLGWGIGTSRGLPGGLLEYRFRGILHAEVGTILNAGEKPTLDEDDRFGRLGPKVELDFWPTTELFDRFSFSVKIRYLWELIGGPTTSDLWETSLNYRLDEKGHVQLQAEYRKGEISLTNERIEAFLVGLGVKF